MHTIDQSGKAKLMTDKIPSPVSVFSESEVDRKFIS